MKSYTDIKQSKKLVDILPLKSADCTRLGKNEDNVLTRLYSESCASGLKEWIGENNIFPCWSLVGLLNILPSGKVLIHDKESHKYKCICNNNDTAFYNNPIDACYEMILKLYKLNLL